jgi:hypothetical protein
MHRDLGDFQTPISLAEKILRRLSADGCVWTRALEPTCGQGNFIQALLRMPVPPQEIIGLEIQRAHIATAKALINAYQQTPIAIRAANIFETDLQRELAWRGTGPLLVVGNPPWVTNSELGSLDSANLPTKRNIKMLDGFDAITGASNFDICEYIWIKLLKELAPQNPTIALLCKTSVARNVISFCREGAIHIRRARMFRINAMEWFKAATDACLFVVEAGHGSACYDVEVYESLDSDIPTTSIGFRRNFLIADLPLYSSTEFAEGYSPYIWRQGVKHDASSIAELQKDADGILRNGIGDEVDIESEFVFPLIKGSDLNGNGIKRPRRWLVVPQRRLHEETSGLEMTAPKLWAYLTMHKKAFDARKSSIYKNAPAFTYFGLGEYSFAEFKIAVAGLYKEPRFRVLTPIDSKPVMLDDTCYFLPFDSLEEANLVANILNSALVKDFLKATMFLDSKRPITKKLLQRIDLHAVASRLNSTLPPERSGQMALRCQF